MNENYGLLEIVVKILVLKVTTEGKEKQLLLLLATHLVQRNLQARRLIQRNLPRNIFH